MPVSKSSVGLILASLRKIVVGGYQPIIWVPCEAEHEVTTIFDRIVEKVVNGSVMGKVMGVREERLLNTSSCSFRDVDEYAFMLVESGLDQGSPNAFAPEKLE